MIPFPFTAFAHSHHGSKPDISVSFPGKTLRVGDWQQIAMVMEAKSTSEQDPFPRHGTSHSDTIIQLAVSARNLMLVHGLLAVFVLGIYGDDVRIARFDHSCAVVAKPFSLKKDYHLLRQFFWRFTHPFNTKVPIVGWDPTICKLPNNIQSTLKKRLKDAGLEVPTDLSKARRALVYESETSNVCKAYILFKLLDVSSRLFSRATMVWAAIEDDGDLSNPLAPLKQVIVKESWRQIVRTSEKEFYQRLDRIPENLRHGLPHLLFGGDLGERDVTQWKGKGSNSDLSPSPSDFSVLSALSRSSPCVPFPQQQTFTWRSSRGPDKDYRERSHMRFVIDVLGRPLTSFRSTKELVMAIRDALIGEFAMLQTTKMAH